MSRYVEVVDAEALRERAAQLGEAIAADYGARRPLVVAVLKGAVPFLIDLTRHLPPDIEIDFLSLTRFGTQGRVGIALDVSVPVAGRDVLVVEDIVDTGLTLATLRRIFTARGARSVRTVALLDKRPRRIVDVPVEYRGFEVGDEFLLGYGLDWQGRYRNLPSIWAVMDFPAFRDDPKTFDALVFPTAARSQRSRP
ncbi:MAG TPA: hypoxanthine phosphoribosyltransferase [Actinobacteria bacterium]|nr:hypoxanthine phosphoribosyltransferase [Actinomycetota bacterium]